LNDVFGALGDPTRRHLVEALAQRDASATELASTLPVTRQAVAKHLTALKRAGLVEPRRQGRETVYRLTPGPLAGARSWIETVGDEWDTRLDRLRTHVAERAKAPGRDGAPPNEVPRSS
jgi:DNA-binding transcriptional ArsR family regulator